MNFSFAWTRGFSVLAIKDGFDGLLKGTVVRLCWDVVKHWSSRVNDCLGSCKYPAAHYGLGASFTLCWCTSLTPVLVRESRGYS